MILQQTDQIPSVIFKTTVKFETGDEEKGLGSGDEDVTLLLALSKSFDDIAFHGNIGYTFVGTDYDSSLKDIFLHGLALEWGFSESFFFVGVVVSIFPVPDFIYNHVI